MSDAGYSVQPAGGQAVEAMADRPVKRVSISRRMRFAVLKRDGFRCRYCGCRAERSVLHIDHAEPLAAGGPNALWNYVTACKDCNLGKGAERLGPLLVLLAAGPVPNTGTEFLLNICLLMKFADMYDDPWLVDDLDYHQEVTSVQEVAKVLVSSSSWGEALRRLLTLSGFPPEWETQ